MATTLPTPTRQNSMFGSHLSVAGGMELAVREAVRLGLDCVQVFTKNQQQWAAPPLRSEAIAAWKESLREAGWEGGPARVASHASYLINLAAAPGELRDKSLALMREEVDRCEVLGIPILVFHPGAHTVSTREEGVGRIAQACIKIINETPGYKTTLCLENVAGAGSTIGREFEELADLRARIVAGTGQPGRIGFCIDTCHAHAAGYDCSSREKAEGVIKQLGVVLGFENIRCLHLNDSIGAMGSRKDRHEHIGEGTIGLGGFAAFVNEPAFAGLPKMLETEKGETAGGESFDAMNVERLRSMIGTRALPALTPIVSGAPEAKPAAKVAKPAKADKKPTGKPARRKPAMDSKPKGG
jgi:deoxyribonuclease-4